MRAASSCQSEPSLIVIPNRAKKLRRPRGCVAAAVIASPALSGRCNLLRLSPLNARPELVEGFALSL
jgi:hypothetical protein